MHRILELFDAGTRQKEIIDILNSEHHFVISQSGICTILDRERPNREKHSHQGSKKLQRSDLSSKELDQRVTSSVLEKNRQLSTNKVTQEVMLISAHRIAKLKEMTDRISILLEGFNSGWPDYKKLAWLQVLMLVGDYETSVGA